MSNHTTNIELCQVDKSDNALILEISQKFTPKKQASELLSASYNRLGYEHKAERVSSCGTFLEFALQQSSDTWHLRKANFCRDRLCPMCSWRRSYKIYAQISQIMNVIEKDYAFLFLTLTVPNCSAVTLSDTIDRLQLGWRKLIHDNKRFKSSVKGFFRVLEVTRNKDRFSPFYNTYHPHFHVILAVSKSYFTSREYIKQSEMLEFWRKAMNDPSITQVDIRRCRNKNELSEGEQFSKSLSSAVAEVAKYSVKSADYLGKFDKRGFLLSPYSEDDIDSFVTVFSSALYGRRLTAFGGVFDDVSKSLQLDDIENGDLVHLDELELRSDVACLIRRFGWSSGAYKMF